MTSNLMYMTIFIHWHEMSTFVCVVTILRAVQQKIQLLFIIYKQVIERDPQVMRGHDQPSHIRGYRICPRSVRTKKQTLGFHSPMTRCRCSE